MIKAERIAALNDHLRWSFSGGKVMLTASVAALSDSEQACILMAARQFDDFNEENDPNGEHDCALFEAAGHSCMFKIDYYDPNLRCGSDDPADPAKTTRVLTIMLASDY